MDKCDELETCDESVSDVSEELDESLEENRRLRFFDVSSSDRARRDLVSAWTTLRRM